MGLKDTAAKNFFGRVDVMGAILDHILYDGKRVVQDGQLCDVCGEQHKIFQNEDGSFRSDNRYRDKLFEYDTGQEVASVGFEFQAYYDSNMVLRIMDYDQRRLRQLAREGRIHRIVNIVLNFDRNRRSPPSSLLQMYGNNVSVFSDYCFNYGFISLNIYDMAEKYDQFPCEELQKVLYLFKCDREERLFSKTFEQGWFKGRMSRDAAIVCAIFLGLNIQIDDESEEIDMCKAVRDMQKRCIDIGEKRGLAKGEKRGLAKGEKLGLAKGRMLAIRELVIKLFNESRSVLEICRLTGYPKKTVQEIALSLQQ